MTETTTEKMDNWAELPWECGNCKHLIVDASDVKGFQRGRSEIYTQEGKLCEGLVYECPDCEEINIVIPDGIVDMLVREGALLDDTITKHNLAKTDSSYRDKAVA